jgi:perosamine synthetase
MTTNDERIAAVARELRDHGFSAERHFWHRRPAFNYRMTNLQAAIGLAQTERLDRLVEKRRGIARRYRSGLAGVPGLIMPPEAPHVRSARWMFGILVEPGFGRSRDELRRLLAERGVETRCFFVPMHAQPILARANAGRRFPVAERLGRTGLYLPTGPGLTDADLDYVVREVTRAAAPVGAR